MLNTALDLAARGYAVFPLSPGTKVPLAGGHGCKDATTDLERIRTWWITHPEANIGLATGPLSGVDVLDIDGEEGEASLRQLEEELGATPYTYEVRTPRGGRHLYFQHREGLKNKAKYLPGIDVRTAGGYVVVPPSHVEGRPYEVLQEFPIAPWDAALFLALQTRCKKAAPAPRAPAKPRTAEASVGDSRYGRGAFDRARERIVGAGEGTRNDTLNEEAFNLAQLHAGGELGDVQDDLVAAAMEAGLPHHEAAKTVASGWKAGLEQPRKAPPRTKGTRGAPASPKRASAEGSTPPKDGVEKTDLGNARRLVRLFGRDLRWTGAQGWLIWDGQRFALDERLDIELRAKQAIEAIQEESQAAMRAGQADHASGLAKWCLQSQSAGHIAAAVSLARSEPGIAVRQSSFDRDPWILNCPNGTLDLRTGKLRQHSREDLLTKVAGCAYDPQAPEPTRWLRFLERCIPDADLRAFLQRWAGYTLTGRIDAECFVFFYGDGSNGKSTFIETIQALLGDYADTASFETFLVRERGQATNDIAALAGARMVVASEPEEGAPLSENVVKLLTGRDRVKARFLYKEAFKYDPEFKVYMHGNHRPRIRGTDTGIWRRVKLVPWTVEIPEAERDPTLKGPDGVFQTQELAGIFRWAMEGCRAWQDGGLGIPQSVVEATKTYRADEDTIGQFLDDRCTVGASAWLTAKEFRSAYEDWCKENGEQPMSQRTVGKQLTERGFHRSRSNGRKIWKGLSLQTVPHSAPSAPSAGKSPQSHVREDFQLEGANGALRGTDRDPGQEG